MGDTTKSTAQEQAEIALANEQAECERQRAEYFRQSARNVSALADEQEISRDAKRRVERVVLAQNELHRVFVFDDVVNPKTVKSCIKQMSTWVRQADDEKINIEIQINSPGGSIFEGLALIDYMRGLSAEGHHITAVTYGMAASMGGVILQAADHRVQGENSFLLLHEGSLFAAGDYGHVEDEYFLMKKLHERILDLFTARAKVSKAFITKKWKRKDWWVSADESLKYGFVDEIR